MIAQKCDTLRILEIGPENPGEHSEYGVFRLILEPPVWEDWRPGQFIMIRAEKPKSHLLWSRALSIGDHDQHGLILYVQTIGRGTCELSLLKPGDQVTVWGPLGNLFSVEPKVKTLILAGGIGIAPFVGYCRRHPNPDSVRLLFSHRKPSGLYPIRTIAGYIGAEAVEDFHDQNPEDLPGFIKLLEERINACASEDLILACGPNPFMHSVRDIAAGAGRRVQVSLENRMVCGLGACLGCVTKDNRERYIQVCARGPVFWSHKVEF